MLAFSSKSRDIESMPEDEEDDILTYLHISEHHCA
jgi:hypothetical protein